MAIKCPRCSAEGSVESGGVGFCESCGELLDDRAPDADAPSLELDVSARDATLIGAAPEDPALDQNETMRPMVLADDLSLGDSLSQPAGQRPSADPLDLGDFELRVPKPPTREIVAPSANETSGGFGGSVADQNSTVLADSVAAPTSDANATLMMDSPAVAADGNATMIAAPSAASPDATMLAPPTLPSDSANATLLASPAAPPSNGDPLAKSLDGAGDLFDRKDDLGVAGPATDQANERLRLSTDLLSQLKEQASTPPPPSPFPGSSAPPSPPGNVGDSTMLEDMGPPSFENPLGEPPHAPVAPPAPAPAAPAPAAPAPAAPAPAASAPPVPAPAAAAPLAPAPPAAAPLSPTSAAPPPPAPASVLADLAVPPPPPGEELSASEPLFPIPEEDENDPLSTGFEMPTRVPEGDPLASVAQIPAFDTAAPAGKLPSYIPPTDAPPPNEPNRLSEPNLLSEPATAPATEALSTEVGMDAVPIPLDSEPVMSPPAGRPAPKAVAKIELVSGLADVSGSATGDLKRALGTDPKPAAAPAPFGSAPTASEVAAPFGPSGASEPAAPFGPSTTAAGSAPFGPSGAPQAPADASSTLPSMDTLPPPDPGSGEQFVIDHVVAPGAGYEDDALMASHSTTSDVGGLVVNRSAVGMDSLAASPPTSVPPTPRRQAGNRVERPLLVARLKNPDIEGKVRKAALGMPATFRTARLEGHQALIVRGLLASQATLLQEKLEKANVFVDVMPASELRTGWGAADLRAAWAKAKRPVTYMGLGVAAVALVAALAFGASSIFDIIGADDRVSSVAMTEPAGGRNDPAPRTGPLAPRQIGFAGHNAQWWSDRIDRLRLAERAAPSSERPKLRALLEDTKRKARVLGVDSSR